MYLPFYEYKARFSFVPKKCQNQVKIVSSLPLWYMLENTFAFPQQYNTNTKFKQSVRSIIKVRYKNSAHWVSFYISVTRALAG